MKEDPELARRMLTIAGSACEELFLAYNVALQPVSPVPRLDATPMLCGVIGLIGRGVRSSCMLAGHDALILASCPTGGGSRDWVGELTNQLAGRVKAKLLRLGVEVALSTPVGLSGVALQPLPRGDLVPLCFEARGGQVTVWVETEADDDFTLATYETPSAHHQEGEIVLF